MVAFFLILFQNFVQSTGTVEQNPNTNNQSTKPTIESVETPLNTVYNELSTVFEEGNVLNLYEPKYYLYLIDGEKVAKYLQKLLVIMVKNMNYLQMHQ
ncbi:hypothetical protein NW733_00280 [Mycoplasmopsis felis]|uniref:hypothetical protein n=1 Tax=Mycoplasmopsis felis TaxID=33923 RepID=UPI0021DFC9C7|nr:hypothetical protein [Mycoplasmopsis felis]MCU9931225.1 hypothetical protein [Mycoplasmopsis felis]